MDFNRTLVYYTDWNLINDKLPGYFFFIKEKLSHRQKLF